MTRRTSLRTFLASLMVALLVMSAPTAAANEQRLIVRVQAVSLLSNLSVVRLACRIVGCDVLYSLDGTLNELFLVRTLGDGELIASLLSALPGIADAEVDRIAHTMAATGTDVPPALLDKEPVSFYGSTVRRGYVQQPADSILGISAARAKYGLTGNGVTVAVIDTGVDTSHPVLSRVLVGGYDFTRNTTGGSELADVDARDQSTVGVVDNDRPAWVNQSTVAVVDGRDQSTVGVVDADQSTVGVVDGDLPAAFGHGTMVAGVVHLTAPRARIMPLKAFKSDGTGYTSDVLRAIYYAVQRGAKVVNMSFSFDSRSREIERAVQYGLLRNVVMVASTGNDGLKTKVYPAAQSGVVGVAATTDYDTLADFSNFGQDVAFIAAPGEGIVSTYPFGLYAAAWGTSFSTPFATGTAALLAEYQSFITPAQAADAAGRAVWISPEVRKGRLDVRAAIKARTGR